MKSLETWDSRFREGDRVVWYMGDTFKSIDTCSKRVMAATTYDVGDTLWTRLSEILIGTIGSW